MSAVLDTRSKRMDWLRPEPMPVGKATDFQATVPMTEVARALHEDAGEPLSDEECRYIFAMMVFGLIVLIASAAAILHLMLRA